MNSICILGGGTAGYITALILKKRFPFLNIKVIKSDQIGIIGVGEGSTPHFDHFIKFCDISHEEIIKYCGATLKASIMFKDWGDKHYNNAVDTSILPNLMQLKIKLLQKFVDKVSPVSIGPIEHLNKCLEYDNPKPVFQFHFDTHKLNEFLKVKSIQRNIEVVDDIITDLEFSDSRELKCLQGAATHKADFFIDATGFKKFIFNHLNYNWVKVNKWLTLNKALVYRTEKNEVPNLWTEAKAMDSGWKFQIPLLERQGNGYIFDSNYTSIEVVHQELELYDSVPRLNPRVISFEAGYLDKCWINNCYATGLTSNFFEPMEASSIALTVNQAFVLCNNLINYSPAIIDRVNKQITRMFENNRDFLILHYLTKKTNTRFWIDRANMELPDSLAAKLELSKNRFLIEDDFSEDGDYALWKEHHYMLVMYGLGMLSSDMLERQYDALPDQVKRQLYMEKLQEIERRSNTKYIMHDKWINEVIKGIRKVG